MLDARYPTLTTKRPQRGRTMICACAVTIIATGIACGHVLAGDTGSATVNRNALRPATIIRNSPTDLPSRSTGGGGFSADARTGGGGFDDRPLAAVRPAIAVKQ